ncbi:MAG: hypothetical protein WDM80_18205 [Limisphaerales bacterium]
MKLTQYQSHSCPLKKQTNHGTKTGTVVISSKVTPVFAGNTRFTALMLRKVSVLTVNRALVFAVNL